MSGDIMTFNRTDDQFPNEKLPEDSFRVHEGVPYKNLRFSRETEPQYTNQSTPFEGAVCMHCGVTLRIRTYHSSRDYIVEHPMGTTFIYRKVIPFTGNTTAWGLALGRWLREVVHPPTFVHATVGQEPPDPQYTEATPHTHLLTTLDPLIGPHLKALGAALHITEALGPMQQWTITAEEDCGFQMEICLRVRQYGKCFDDVRRQRDVSHRDSMGNEQTEGSHTHPETNIDEFFTSAEQDALLRREGDGTEPGSDTERDAVLPDE